jgi:hypothetical protein
MMVVYSLAGGCGESRGTKSEPEVNLGAAVGSLTEVLAVQSIRVEGYGLVGGLRGTGSARCPPDIREYLRQYILTQLPERRTDIEKLIDSRNTAVVTVRGIMPAAVARDQRFDLKVEALSGTQTTSLEGGWLYRAELKAAGGFGIGVKVVGSAEGPVFIDTIETVGVDERVGYVLAGGRVLGKYKVRLALRKPDYRIANAIRNRLNNRFPAGTAKAVSPGLIELRVPAEYGEQEERFISIVKALYLAETPEITGIRVSAFLKKLAHAKDKQASEVALEAIGSESLKGLSTLLNSFDGEVRLRAARCMLNLGSEEGLDVLRRMAVDRRSANRIEALEAITTGANRRDAASISRRLLRDRDFVISLAAYEQLRKLDDISISRTPVAGNFYLEQIIQTKHKVIFVSRSGQPRIVLFGAPLYCRGNIFVESADGEITLSTPTGGKYVSVMRRIPNRPEAPPVQLKSSFKLSDIIRTLCEEPVVKEGSAVQPGLNVSYAQVIAVLKQMCQKGTVAARFRAGPLPEID